MRHAAIAVAGLASVAAAQSVVINEFVFNHTGSDAFEYVELFAGAGSDLSTLAILVIEGDGAVAGTIDAVLLPGTADAGGYWVSGFLSNGLENGSQTLLLVDGFTGLAGEDLDVDNDGVLDATPWSGILDAVAINDGGVDDLAYASTVLAPGFDGTSFAPGGASRLPNGLGGWVRNDFDLAGIPGFTGTPDVGEALNTPGAMNVLIPAPGVAGLAALAAIGAGRRRR